MKQTMSRIITIYTLCWMAALIWIGSTREEMELAFQFLFTFVCGLIVLIGLIVIKKWLGVAEGKARDGHIPAETMSAIVWSVLLVAVILFVVGFSLLN